jgi:hypothetical protein
MDETMDESQPLAALCEHAGFPITNRQLPPLLTFDKRGQGSPPAYKV